MKREPFASIPNRVYEALERGDITYDEYAVLCFVAGKANYRRQPPELVRTLRAMVDALQWEQSDDTLGRVLKRLKRKRWIDFTVKRGMRSPTRSF